MHVNQRLVQQMEHDEVLALIAGAPATITLGVLRPEPLAPTSERHLSIVLMKSKAEESLGMKLVTVGQGGTVPHTTNSTRSNQPSATGVGGTVPPPHCL
jgi:hypothetical protein